MSLQIKMIEESKIEESIQLEIDDSKSNVSVKIPKILQDEKFTPQVVEGEDVLQDNFYK